MIESVLMKRFLIKTFGCQMNKDDSERIAGLLSGAGYQPAAGEAEADVIVFNTCCVRRHADDRLYGQAASLKQLKAARPDLVIAVGGCLAQMDKDKVNERLRHVDVVFGTHNLSRLPLLIAEATSGGRPVCEVSEGTDDFAADLPAVRRHSWHAWLPITVGCDNFCTYCIVPYVRGPERSRPPERLVDECVGLAADGVEEVTLLGQNVNSYGRDLYGEPRFAQLLQTVASVPGIKRIRFTTSHPKDLTGEIIDAVAVHENVCPHFHLPLQSGSDRILKKMCRQYTAEDYLGILAGIRKKVDQAAVSTDIMVAFPGETEADFKDTLDVVEAAGFDQAFTFIYSPRPGTAAAVFKDQVPPEVASERFARLVEAQNRNSLQSNRRLLGDIVPVFIEGHSKKSRYRLAARTPANKLVHLKGDDDLIGRTLNVQIKEAFSWFLIGTAKEAV